LKKEQKHREPWNEETRSKKLFSGRYFAWTKSRDEVWASIEGKMGESRSVARPVVFLQRQWFRYAAAAVLALLIGTGFFIRFYARTIVSPPGQHLLAELPDGSTVYLNAESELAYHPYWWKVKRIVGFEGEGFFEIKKGKDFQVRSQKGTTHVLGTSFNIFSRGGAYEVTCISGKVNVRSKTRQEMILEPKSKASVTSGGNIEVFRSIDVLPEIAWKDNLFLFTATPVGEVFREIERQYGISIRMLQASDLAYSGNFTKDQPVEEILTYICLALGYEYEKTGSGSYAVRVIPE